MTARPAALVALFFCACRSAPPVQAQAAAEVAATVAAESSSDAGAQAAAAVQTASVAHIEVHRAPRHVSFSVTPAPDGGTPTFSFNLDEGAEDLVAGATGTADAGALGAAEAAAEALSDAGATADAGARASAPAPSSASLPWYFRLSCAVGVLCLAILGAALKFGLPPWR